MLLLLFDSVLFMSSLMGGETTISTPSAPSVHVTSPGWQQHSSFGIHLQRRKNPSEREWEAFKDIHLRGGEEIGRGCR